MRRGSISATANKAPSGVKAPLLLALLLLGACDRQAPAAANGGQAEAGENAQRTHAPGVRFPALTGRVVDRAELLSPAEEARLTAASEAVERDVGPQFVIVTVPDLQGTSIEEYGVGLGRHWGVGHAGRNDGVLLIVAMAERKARIEVGYGLERRITDPYAARVIREQIIPRFRENQFPAGITAGSEAIIARLRSGQSEGEIAAEDHLVT
jgi:uncharacterized protein